jgi:hypothetical protein
MHGFFDQFMDNSLGGNAEAEVQDERRVNESACAFLVVALATLAAGRRLPTRQVH